MTNALLPLHMGSGPFLPGLVAGLILVILLLKFARHGRVGPVRWAPGGPGGPGRHAGPPWAQSWPAQRSPEEEALATLAERLASGDITPEEYLERSTALRDAQPRGE